MSDLWLREAVPEDLELLFAWRNMPEIVSLGRSLKTVSWDEHVKWFERVLQDDGCLLLIACDDKEPIGQIRFDRSGDSAEVSIYLVPQAQGRGLGSRALVESCSIARRRLALASLTATIRKQNQRALRAFQRAGFVVSGDDAEFVHCRLLN